jgi:hypothetical protein
VQGHRVVDAVAQERHVHAGTALRGDDAGLVLGADPGEHGGAGDQFGEPGVVGGVDVGAGDDPSGGQAEVGADLRRHRRVVPGDDLDLDAETGEPVQGRAGGGLRRVGEDQQPAQPHPLLVGRGHAALPGGGAVGDGDDPVPGGELGVQRMTGFAGDVGASPQHLLRRPFADDRAVAAGVVDQDGHGAPVVVERQRVQAVVSGHGLPVGRRGG